jgi:hypothetical protein
MLSDATISPPRPGSSSVFDEAPQRTWFEAPTAAGTVRLRVTGAVRHAADAAIVLARCGELIDALEEWSGIALAWRWVAALSPTTAESHARVLWRFDVDGTAGGKAAPPSEPGWQLELPWTLLRVLPAPTGVLAQRLCWLEVPVVMATAQIQLSAGELQLLEPGGAVILPESVHAESPGLLRASDEPARAGWGMPAAMRLPSSVRRVASGPRPEIQTDAAVDGAWCEVRLDGLRAVPGDRLAGWYDGDLGPVGTRASLWRCATDLETARPLATGTLVPWADGWALLLQALCEAPRPAAVVSSVEQVALSVPA